MPRQTMSPVQKVSSTPKRRATTSARRTSKKAEAPINEPVTRSAATQSSNSGAFVLLLIVGIVILGIGGYYWFTQYKNKVAADAVYQDYQIPLGVNVPVAEEPPAEPVMQTYQNETAHYSFQYPQDWSLTASSTKDNKQVAVFTTTASTTASTTVSVITVRTPKPLAQYVTELDALAKTAFAGKPSMNIIESRDVAVNNVPVIARRQTLAASGQEELIAYFGIKDYVVSIAVTDTHIATSSIQMYENLVNSFAVIASTTPSIATTTATTTASSTQSAQ